MRFFYIAARLENANLVKKVRDRLVHEGWNITHDWSIEGSVTGTTEALRRAAWDELRGVRTADAVIVLLPGGRGTHVELGAALILNLPVLVWAPDDLLLGVDRDTCAFYHLAKLRHGGSAVEAAVEFAHSLRR